MISAYTLYLTPTADQDITAAIEYYNLQAEDLGYRFADLVQQYLHRIILTPTASPVRYRDIRCKPMATFPYLIAFSINEQQHTITVLRIFHTHQNPMW